MSRIRAAIFDLDGTLIPASSAEKLFFFHELKNGGFTILDMLRMLQVLIKSRGDFHSMIRENKYYLRGKDVSKITNIVTNFFEPIVPNLVFHGMKDLIESHRAKGDILLLLSGTLDVIASCFTRQLKFDGFRAGKLEIRNGHYTGRIQGVLPYGIGKLESLHEFHEEFKFDLNTSLIYANQYSDRYIMFAMNNPIAVNPDKRLLKLSQKLKWPIYQF